MPLAAVNTTLLQIPFSSEYGMRALGVDNRRAFKQLVVDFLAAGHREFVIDFRTARYVDSQGLGVLVSIAKKVREAGGSLVLVGLNDDLTTLFRLTKLDTVLDVRTVEQWVEDGGAL